MKYSNFILNINCINFHIYIKDSLHQYKVIFSSAKQKTLHGPCFFYPLKKRTMDLMRTAMSRSVCACCTGRSKHHCSHKDTCEPEGSYNIHNELIENITEEEMGHF